MDNIIDDKILERIIKELKLKISKSDHDLLVSNLYKHIEYTRLKAYGLGYNQGKFDLEMDLLIEQRKAEQASEIIGESMLELNK
ncbi:hypothetical protein CHH83_02160 [Bacillus sp. 7586-K]|nr:hypothetical protein CHH83_02160 [Bacillus sp. 7586-K]